jgi:hypothetical protein
MANIGRMIMMKGGEEQKVNNPPPSNLGLPPKRPWAVGGSDI